LIVESEASVRELQPNFRELHTILGVRGLIVSIWSNDHQFDFVSRFFAPGAGIDEDPVTGSAHCCLAPFWARRLGKTEMTGFQASRRGGIVRMRLRRDPVMLDGHAVMISRGALLNT
jgi:predicted PhzF superfamily epimerase YddE/YHI9